MAALVALAVGSVLAAMAPNLAVLIVARVIQGLGGGTLPLGFGIIRDEFPAGKVAGAVGILAALTAVGGSLGIVLACLIVNALNWHWLFWLPGIATVIAAVGAVVFVPQSPIRSPGTISWLPAVLLSGWLVALLVPLSEASDWGWGAPVVGIGLLAGAVLLAAAWVWSELRAATPLIDMKMMRRPGVWTNNLVALAVRHRAVRDVRVPARVRSDPVPGGVTGFGASIIRSGLMLLPAGVTMFAVGLFVGTLTRRFGGKVLVVAGCVIGCVAMSMFAFAHSQEWEIYVATGVLGIGFGLAFSAMSANVVSAVPAEQTSVATGMNANIRTIGGSIGAAVMASIVTAKLEPSGLPTQAGYTTGFGVMAAVLAVAALAALLIPSQRRLGTAATKAAAWYLAMSGDAVTAESAAGETLASELGSEVASEPSMSDQAGPPSPPGRRDAVRNYHRVLNAAREVLGESGADAGMEEIAARAGVGIGTVYRRFANKDALIDELVRLSLCEALAEARQALACPGGDGLEQFLRGLGRCSPRTPSTRTCCSSGAPTAPPPRDPRRDSAVDPPCPDRGHAEPRRDRWRRDGTGWGKRGLTETSGEVAPGTGSGSSTSTWGARAPGPGEGHAVDVSRTAGGGTSPPLVLTASRHLV